MLDVFITSRVRRKIIVVYAKYPDFKTHGVCEVSGLQDARSWLSKTY